MKTDTIDKPKLNLDLDIRLKPALPAMWQAVLVNDDKTPFEIVIVTLMDVFSKAIQEASSIMMTAHQKGSALVMVSTKDIIESKVLQAQALSSQCGFSLTYLAEPAP